MTHYTLKYILKSAGKKLVMVDNMMDKMLLSLIGDKWAGLNKINLQIETKAPYLRFTRLII